MRIKKLQAQLHKQSLLIYNPYLIEYYLGTYFEVGERFIGLLITDDSKYLIINKLFDASNISGVEVIEYLDGESYAEIIKKLIMDGELLVDDTLWGRFIFELLKQDIKVFDGSLLINHQRIIKDESEIIKMKKSSALNDYVMGLAHQYLKEGITEQAVAEYIKQQYLKLGASGEAFETIVAFGENGADPHALASDRRLKKGDSVIIDMGCRLDGYCSDMTRTFLYGQTPMNEIYHLVLKANMEAKKLIKPGVALKVLDLRAREIITEAGYGAYFNHRLGHGCGKEVHEPYDVAMNTEVLMEEGMIFSIEPGIYIPGVGGVRIEDLVLVTKDGYLSLNNYPYDNNELK